MLRTRAAINVLNMVKTGKEEIPVEKQFLNDLKASIEIQDAKSAYKPSRSYKPSSMNCIRNMYFQIIGEDGNSDRMSSELVGICEAGSDRHERIQDSVLKMKGSGIDCEYLDVAEYVSSNNLTDKLDIISKQGYETKLFHKELNIRFLCDGIIKYKGEYFILEIKTETNNKHWKRSGVADEHKNQGTAYAEALGIRKVMFVYECRDNCSKKSYILNVTDEMIEKYIEKIKLCDSYVAKKEKPPKPTEAGAKFCAYCPYALSCKE